MDEHGLTEQDAFRFIQRTAMRERRTMKAVGEQIIAGALTADRAVSRRRPGWPSADPRGAR